MLQVLALASLVFAGSRPSLATPPTSVPAAEVTGDVLMPTFAPGTSPQYMQLVFTALPPVPEYFLGPRWNGVQGAPAVVTWSFAPDNLVIPSLIGENGQLNALFARMDALFTGQGGRAAWIARIQDTFDRWEALSGIDFVRITVGGNDWDDGATWGAFGSATRGDIRIAMKRLDSVDGVLAIGAFPGNGDIVLDRFENWGLSTDSHRYLRNNFGKNLGHAIGLDLVCPNDDTKLMEPIVSAALDGPQQDEVRGVQRHYGDPFEPDDSALAATNLGAPTISVPIQLGALPPPLVGGSDPNAALLSIDADGENDWWKFNIAAPQFFDVSVTPVGSVYANGTQDGGGGCTIASPNFDALAHADLAVQVLAPDGTTVLANANSNGSGLAESLIDVGLNAAGTYYVRVYETNAPTQAQGYRVDLLVKACNIDTDNDGTPDCADGCPLDALKTAPGACGCGVPDVDSDFDGTADCNDGCPSDANKTAPGQCGCGVSDFDGDGDGVADCLDSCPSDPNKIFPGVCGCGVPDADSDGDGVLDCNDGCPSDPLKIAPGICGCGVSDIDSDGDGVADCLDGCPNDPLKLAPGLCGCGIPDADSDGDGVVNCLDGCPSDPLKTAPGVCGCGVLDVDGDAVAECIDNCPLLFNPNQNDADNDATGDVCDNCVFNFNPAQEDCDADGDGDVCEIANGSESDCDQNGIPDTCESDCNGNGQVDGCDILLGSSLDQNANRIPDECEAPCPAIQSYCTGKPNSLGCVPMISASGIPSASSPSGFVITCTKVIPDRNGLLFYGFAASYAPFQGGYLCVKPPFQRTSVQLSTGAAPCDAIYQFDFNAWIATGHDALLVPGTNVFARWWMRDPQATFTTGFSNAITFTICN